MVGSSNRSIFPSKPDTIDRLPQAEDKRAQSECGPTIGFGMLHMPISLGICTHVTFVANQFNHIL